MSLNKKLADSHPDLKQGIVKCETCGREVKVNSAKCFSDGWPECCCHTMTLTNSNGMKFQRAPKKSGRKSE